MRAAKLRVQTITREIQRGRKLQVVLLVDGNTINPNGRELLWSLEITIALIEAKICR
jgi:hypothetical protein